MAEQSLLQRMAELASRYDPLKFGGGNNDVHYIVTEAAGRIAKLEEEARAIERQAEGATEYVLAQINERLRGEAARWKEVAESAASKLHLCETKLAGEEAIRNAALERADMAESRLEERSNRCIRVEAALVEHKEKLGNVQEIVAQMHIDRHSPDLNAFDSERHVDRGLHDLVQLVKDFEDCWPAREVDELRTELHEAKSRLNQITSAAHALEESLQEAQQARIAAERGLEAEIKASKGFEHMASEWQQAAIARQNEKHELSLRLDSALSELRGARFTIAALCKENPDGTLYIRRGTLERLSPDASIECTTAIDGSRQYRVVEREC